MLFAKLHDADKDGLEIYINPSKVVCIQKVDVGRSKGKTRVWLANFSSPVVLDVNESPEQIIDILNRVDW